MLLAHRQREARARAAALAAVSAELCVESRRLRDEALRLRASRVPARNRCTAPTALPAEGWFTVRGIVDGTPTVARWWPGLLDCDTEVARRASVVVALGDTFSAPESSAGPIAASLDAPPIAVLLTIMRAFSSVTAVDLSVEMLTPAADI